MSQKTLEIKTLGPKIGKKRSADFRFFLFLCGHFIPLVGSQRPQHVLQHTELQSETRGMQGFDTTSGARGDFIEMKKKSVKYAESFAGIQIRMRNVLYAK